MRVALLSVALLTIAGCSDAPAPTPLAPPPAAAPHPAALLALEQAPPPRAVPLLDTPEGVIADIVAKLDAESRAKLRDLKKDDLILYHHGWGTGIRNQYGLWSNSALLRRCAARAGYGEFIHPDSASMLIMEGVWEAVSARQ
ncbi:hypothetical protein J0H58_36770 [bacterium]|nr:hypothetical protein [bacterium]